MVESFLKGGVLLFAKEGIIRSTQSFGLGELTSSLIGGFGGGVTQVVVIAPCTYVVSAAVISAKTINSWFGMPGTKPRASITSDVGSHAADKLTCFVICSDIF